MKNIQANFKQVESTDSENSLIFRLTEKEGSYGIIFKGLEAVAFAMFNKEDFSLAVAFKKDEKAKYAKSDVLLSVFNVTDNFYGMSDYRVTENNNIIKEHYKKFMELNEK